MLRIVTNIHSSLYIQVVFCLYEEKHSEVSTGTVWIKWHRIKKLYMNEMMEYSYRDDFTFISNPFFHVSCTYSKAVILTKLSQTNAV